MKKITACFLALILALGMTACSTANPAAASSGAENPASAAEPSSQGGASPEAAGGDRTLRLGHYLDPANTEDANMVKMKALYEDLSAKTGIDIVIETIPWDQIEGKMVMTNQAGDPSADVYLMSSQKLASVVNAGALTPLDDYIARDIDKSKYVPATFDTGTFAGDGKVYCVLSSIHSRGLWYNKELMPDPPTTRDELVAAAQAATDPDNNIWGFGFWGNQHYGSMEVVFGPMIWDLGGALCDSDGKATWASAETEEVVKFFSDCLSEYKISPQTCLTMSDYVEVQDLFIAGNIASFITGTYGIAQIQESQLYQDGKVGYVPIPGKDGPAPNFSNGWAFGIPSKSKKPDLAWEMVNAFLQTDNQTAHAAFEGGMPTTLESYDDPLFSEGIYKDFQDNMINGRSMDPFVHYQEGLEAVSMAKSAYMMDPTQDLTELLTNAQNDFNTKFYS